MSAHGTMAAKQSQIATMSPEHIMGKAVLKMSLLEVQQYVELQFAENPALSMDENAQCPSCGSALIGNFCPGCGAEKVDPKEEYLPDNDDWQAEVYSRTGPSDAEFLDPFSRVASPKTLIEHLKEDVRLAMVGDELEIAEFIIDSLDEDGYLRESILEIAGTFGKSIPQLEEILHAVQALDPPGVGARDLRECLLLQLARIGEDSPEKALAETILRDHWDALSRMKIDKIAARMKLDSGTITAALRFLRESTTPHPAGIFRDAWEGLCPHGAARTRPDVVVQRTEHGFAADLVDPSTGRVAVDEMYASMYEELSRSRDSYSESDRAHVREQVEKARALIEALEFRKSSLRKIIDELLVYQSDFFTRGPLALKPLMKKELALKIGLHESTVCRATQDKFVRLPSGEVIPLDTLFDSALPVREKVRELAMNRLSDGEISEKLSEMGVVLARRTVAKYREQLGVLPAEFRVVGGH